MAERDQNSRKYTIEYLMKTEVVEKPVEPFKPMEFSKPVEPQKPVKPPKPMKPSKPVEPLKPSIEPLEQSKETSTPATETEKPVFSSCFSVDSLLEPEPTRKREISKVKNDVVKAFGKRLTSLLADRSNTEIWESLLNLI